jgi:D-sedoheptulose 7-phosphate isomerase
VDACLIAPSDNTARIQEAHLLVGHILCDLVEARFAPPAA